MGGPYYIYHEQSLLEGDLFTSYEIHGPFGTKAECQREALKLPEDDCARIFKAPDHHRYVAIVVDLKGEMLDLDTAKHRSRLIEREWWFSGISYHPHTLDSDGLDHLQEWLDGCKSQRKLPRPTTKHSQFMCEQDDLCVMDSEATRRRIERGKGRREYSELFMIFKKLPHHDPTGSRRGLAKR
jgi:hypothetical protein